MSVQSLAEGGRRLAALMFIDTGVISRGDATPVFDPNTGTLTPDVASVIHTGPCRIRMPAAVETNVIFGDAAVTRTRFMALFPHDVPLVMIGDVVMVTVSDDPHIVNRRFRVMAVPSTSVLTHRKFGCEVIE